MQLWWRCMLRSNKPLLEPFLYCKTPFLIQAIVLKSILQEYSSSFSYCINFSSRNANVWIQTQELQKSTMVQISNSRMLPVCPHLEVLWRPALVQYCLKMHLQEMNVHFLGGKVIKFAMMKIIMLNAIGMEVIVATMFSLCGISGAL